MGYDFRCAVALSLTLSLVLRFQQSLLLNDRALLDPLLLRHRVIADEIMPHFALQLLHVAPAIGSAVFQPKYRGCRIRRLPVPADGELVETALNPVIGRLFSGL